MSENTHCRIARKIYDNERLTERKRKRRSEACLALCVPRETGILDIGAMIGWCTLPEGHAEFHNWDPAIYKPYPVNR